MDLDSDNERVSDASEDVIEQLIVQEFSEFTVDEAINKIGIGSFQLNVFLFSGLVWITNALIIAQVAVLGPSWQCEFQLTNSQLATITIMLPLGNMIGSVPFGFLCDRYGRKKVVNISNLFILYFAIMSSFVPGYNWILILRLLLGTFVIVGNQITTYCVEFMPVRFRSPAVISLNLFFSLGIGIIVLLGYLITPVYGWRYLTFASSLMCVIVPIYYWFVPTSPRFLVENGRLKEARGILEVAARMNRSSLPEGQLVRNRERTEVKENKPHDLKNLSAKGGIKQMFSRKYAFTTLCLALLWFTSGFLYYALFLLSSDIFTYDHHCPSNPPNNYTINSVDLLKYCNEITPSGYLEIFINTLAEVPGIIITVLVIDIIGRKLTFAVEMVLPGLMFFLLIICTPHSFIIKTILLSTIRALIVGVFNACFLYTVEVYPTDIRASALAFLSSFARFATIITSYIAQVLFRVDPRIALTIFGTLGIVTGLVSLLLPYETKGKKIG